jgi:predicted GIY-YIG superfamily endonuclease
MMHSTTCPIPAALLQRCVYLLHFYNPQTGESAKLAHAAHYCGSSDDVSARLAEHGTTRGAKLTYAVRQAGLSWVVARTWHGGRRLEYQLKRRHNAPRQLCPICKGEITLAEVLAAQPAPSTRPIGRRLPMPNAHSFNN